MDRVKQRLLSLSILLIGLGLYLPLYQKMYRSYRQFSDRQEQPAQVNNNSPLGVTASADGTEEYELTSKGIRVTDKKTGRQQEFKLPCRFPELSWGTDITYDSKRNLVTVVSLGGRGYLYRFDVQQRRWLDFRSLNNVDLKSITYDRVGDRYIAWGNGMLEDGYWADNNNLVIISADGRLLDYENVAPRMLGFKRLSDYGNKPEPIMKIRAYGNHITFMAYSSDPFQSVEKAPLAVWRYNLASKRMLSSICKYARYRYRYQY